MIDHNTETRKRWLAEMQSEHQITSAWDVALAASLIMLAFFLITHYIGA